MITQGSWSYESHDLSMTYHHFQFFYACIFIRFVKKSLFAHDFWTKTASLSFFVHVRKLKGNNILARMIGGFIYLEEQCPWFLVLIGKYRLAVDWSHGRHCVMRATNNGVGCHFLSTFHIHLARSCGWMAEQRWSRVVFIVRLGREPTIVLPYICSPIGTCRSLVSRVRTNLNIPDNTDTWSTAEFVTVFKNWCLP